MIAVDVLFYAKIWWILTHSDVPTDDPTRLQITDFRSIFSPVAPQP